MDEVTRICDEVIFLDRGQIVAHDTPTGLIAKIPNSRLRAMFEGPPEQALSALRPHFTPVGQPAHTAALPTPEAHRLPQALFDIGNRGVRLTRLHIQKPTL